jgi:hypothetical protein
MTRRSSSSRRHRRRWRVWVLTAAGIGTVGVVTFASAAHLGVFSNDRELDEASPCTDWTLPTSAGNGWHGDYWEVSITGIPVGCNDLAVELVVYDASGAQLATGTGTTGTTGTATISTSTYTASAVQGVALLFDTWGIHTTWTAPTEPPPISCVPLNRNNDNSPVGQSCTAEIASPTAYYPNSDPPGGELFGFQINVTSTTPRWRVTIDFTDPYFHWVPQWVNLVAGNVGVYGGCGTPPYSTFQIQPPQGTSGEWGAVLLIGENGAPTYPPGGAQLCP